MSTASFEHKPPPRPKNAKPIATKLESTRQWWSVGVLPEAAAAAAEVEVEAQYNSNEYLHNDDWSSDNNNSTCVFYFQPINDT
jgi:hypothetical protein